MINEERYIHKCKNPRCITQVEKYVPQRFTLCDKKNNVYLCDYCHGENVIEAILNEAV